MIAKILAKGKGIGGKAIKMYLDWDMDRVRYFINSSGKGSSQGMDQT
jgi:hypothetical protein